MLVMKNMSFAYVLVIATPGVDTKKYFILALDKCTEPGQLSQYSD
jgi:hypothetical protein